MHNSLQAPTCSPLPHYCSHGCDFQAQPSLHVQQHVDRASPRETCDGKGYLGFILLRSVCHHSWRMFKYPMTHTSRYHTANYADKYSVPCPGSCGFHLCHPMPQPHGTYHVGHVGLPACMIPCVCHHHVNASRPFPCDGTQCWTMSTFLVYTMDVWTPGLAQLCNSCPDACARMGQGHTACTSQGVVWALAAVRRFFVREPGVRCSCVCWLPCSCFCAATVCYTSVCLCVRRAMHVLNSTAMG